MICCLLRSAKRFEIVRRYYAKRAQAGTGCLWDAHRSAPCRPRKPSIYQRPHVTQRAAAGPFAAASSVKPPSKTSEWDRCKERDGGAGIFMNARVRGGNCALKYLVVHRSRNRHGFREARAEHTYQPPNHLPGFLMAWSKERIK